MTNKVEQDKESNNTLVWERVNNETNVILRQAILSIHLKDNLHQVLSGRLPATKHQVNKQSG